MIDETQDYIDSRDVINRIDELEAMRDEWIEYQQGEGEEEDTPEPFGKEEQDELDELLELQSECDYGDWRYGETLISDRVIDDYLDDMIRDCYAIPDLPSFMSIEIDYAALKMDYTEIEFRGETFYIRA